MRSDADSQPVPRTLPMEEALRQKGWCVSGMLCSELTPEPPARCLSHRSTITRHTEPQLPALPAAGPIRIDPRESSRFQPPEVISHGLMCPPQLGRLDGDTTSWRATCQPVLWEPMYPAWLEGGTQPGWGAAGPVPSVQCLSSHYNLKGS